MADRHRHPPLTLRLPGPDRAWLYRQQDETGRPVRAIVADAVAAYRRAGALSPLDELRARAGRRRG